MLRSVMDTLDALCYEFTIFSCAAVRIQLLDEIGSYPRETDTLCLNLWRTGAKVIDGHV